jgi:hypothetical protein
MANQKPVKDEKLIIVNRAEQTVIAKRGDKLFHKCECVLGRLFYRTPSGKNFRIEKKYPSYTSIKYKAKMNHAMFFTTTGEAIHEYDGEIDWKFQRDHQAILGFAWLFSSSKIRCDKAVRLIEEKKTKVWVI